MGTCYEQLSAAERKTIGRLHAAGQSGRAIARTLVRAPTTISRELQRNSQQTRSWPGGHYEGTRAQMLTERRRRWDARHKLARQPALRAIVGNFLAMGWSPEQIAGRLARLQKYPTISPESIYRFIYHRSAQKDYWHRLLPRRKSRRGRLGRRGGGGPTRYLQGRVPISRRPKVASARRQAGHWEADLMLFRTYGQAVLVAHERVSRLTRLLRQPSKAAKPVLDGLLTLFSPSRASCAAPSPSTMAPSSPCTAPSAPSSACGPSSASRTHPGKRAASRMPSDACDDPCPENPTSL